LTLAKGTVDLLGCCMLGRLVNRSTAAFGMKTRNRARSEIYSGDL